MPATRHRIDSIDLLRGLVIVLMALDHARDFFSPFGFQPENLGRTSPALFLTRWVTHFCAPVFVFLAGLGTALYQARGHRRGEVAAWLTSRGLWLIVLEVTVINLSWLQFVYGGFVFIQVIWALGWSMILLAALIYLPRAAVATVALGMIFGHNLLDGIKAADFGDLAVLWAILHEQYWQPLSESLGLVVVYPLVPWIGVMAVGYLFGDLYALDADRRRRRLLRIGIAATVAFVVLRLVNLYGDPSPWQEQERGALYTVLSFLNTTKYPASLLFLLMTLGPSIWLLPWFEHARGRLASFFITFGRVPLFFYLIHVPVLHAIAAVYSLARYGSVGWWFGNPKSWPEAYEPNLQLAWAAWIVVTLALYPLCAWFAGVKKRRRAAWFRYL